MSLKKKKPQLLIVFDTNALYTKATSDLLNEEVTNLIQNTKHNDIEIIWYLPEVVRHERQYQMQRSAFELLPTIQKLEKLLGHALGFTKASLEKKVQETVESNIKSLNLRVLPIESSKVDWKAVMLASAYHQPPFDAGEKEKGFRDALVAESFLQLVETSPVTSKACRIVLVTNDSLLTDAIRNRTNERSNVRLLRSVDELKGFINTISSEVGEEFIKAISDDAANIFFTKENKESLIIKESIQDKIKSQFPDKFTSLPADTFYREDGTWYVSPPQFIRKKGSRISWSTRIIVEAKAFNFAIKVTTSSSGTSTVTTGLTGAPPPSQPLHTGLFGLGFATPTQDQREPKNYFAALLKEFDDREKVLAKIGNIVFEVRWSVQVSPSKKFTAPKIEEIIYIETIWNEPDPSLNIIR
nr:PIN domain-containing protein [Nitrosomonas nitrosa]